MKTLLSVALMVLLVITRVASMSAQDRFGSAVAVAGSNVVVLKPTNSRGPATVYLFGQDESGSWSAVDRFYPQAASQTGEAFGRSLSVAQGLVMVASGDPKGFWGGTAMTYDATAGLQPTGRLPLVDTASVEEGELDLAGIMNILQPAQRVVATDGNSAAVAVLGGGSSAGVRVYRRDDSGRWVEEANLAPAGGDRHRAFGSSLVLSGNRVFVGSPGEEDHGSVYLFARDDAGEWHQDSRFLPQDPEARGFGVSVALDGDRLLVGESGTEDRAGAVTVYQGDETDGSWAPDGRLVSPDGAADERFGAALAVHGEDLWVGAPNADERTGRVYRFARVGSTEQWTAAGSLNSMSLQPGDQFGASVSVGDALAVVGAPRANGNAGRAVVYARSDDGWIEQAVLDDGLRFDMIVDSETPCDDGRASHFNCDNVDLLAYLPVDSFGGGAAESVSDIWGWTDPETGREYVLVGRTGGAAFIDITNPTSPVYLGIVPANNSGARDLKVYRDHLFFTGDGAGDHGLVVFDLTRLRNVSQPPVEFEPDARYTGIASAHNLILDPESGYAYPVGASGGGETCGGGLHMVDIRDPVNPAFAGCYTDTEGLLWAGRTHDGQCVVYRGPDEDHQGRQVCFASNETALRVVDVTDKENPVPLAAATYPGRAYIHQGWLTDDQRYFYLNDELDELVGQADRTRTLILDVADLDDPVIVGEYLGTTMATDHNLYIKGNTMYQANYSAGLQIIDITDRENPVEVGHFDTTPYDGGNPPGFSGAWTAFPFFESGVVVVSSRAEGLFIVKPSPPELVP